MKELENLTKENLTINIVWANLFGFLMLAPVVFVYGIPFYFIWRHQYPADRIGEYMDNLSVHIMPLVLIILAGIILHELIHGITWSFFTKRGFKSIRFGVMWKMITPYCHCKEPLKVKHYVLGAIMPGLLVGVLPAIIALIKGNLPLLIFAIFFTVAAAGDFLMVHLLRKESRESWVQDHPSETGCYIYRSEEKVV
ncbi:DUF3267 domain-containing protein [Prolixibacter denitrificans]|uniref:Putative zincin peptidase n=1 Tax=Prolixibacter denitrificans TaxID=1541063 RepID=A0A2P8CFH1_9BACT|nr:DUF3267 domain-containing protein [Prolixibacter denitrificans]PSK83728.1 putative zincin peptidase [Prolixibacter denitrificans]GET23272.1 hypothetical protein JCM18694_35180 [Prolixibacter denitrificans]